MKKVMSTCPRLNLIVTNVSFLIAIFSCLAALKNLMSTCPGLNLVNHRETSRSVTTYESWFQPIRGGLVEAWNNITTIIVYVLGYINPFVLATLLGSMGVFC